MLKDKDNRNAEYMRFHRLRDCTLRIHGVCNFNIETSVGAHSNFIEHGKGRGYKTPDWLTVTACSSCHAWLDQGRASYEEKRDAFENAVKRQVQVLRSILDTPTQKHNTIQAVKWAYTHLHQFTHHGD